MKWVELNHEEELFLRGSRCQTCGHLESLHQVLAGTMLCLVCVDRLRQRVQCERAA